MLSTPAVTASYAAINDLPWWHDRISTGLAAVFWSATLLHSSGAGACARSWGTQLYLLCMPDSELETGSRVPPKLHTKMAPLLPTVSWMDWWNCGFSSVHCTHVSHASSAQLTM